MIHSMTGYGKSVRGKVDFSIYVEATAEDTSTQINTPVVKQYIAQLKQVVDGNDIDLLKMAVRFPDALNTVREEIDESEWGAIEKEIQTKRGSRIKREI